MITANVDCTHSDDRNNITIEFTYKNVEIWQVKKSFDDFVELQKALKSANIADLTTSATATSSELTLYLNQILKPFDLPSKVWKMKPLLEFIEGGTSSKSKFANISISSMQEEIEQLQSKNEGYDRQIDILTNNYQQLLQMMNNLVGKPDVFPSVGLTVNAPLEAASAFTDVQAPVPVKAVAAVSLPPPGLVRSSGSEMKLPSSSGSWISIVKGETNDSAVTDGIATLSSNPDDTRTANSSTNSSNRNSFYLTEEDRKTNFPPIIGDISGGRIGSPQTPNSWFSSANGGGSSVNEDRDSLVSAISGNSKDSAFLFSRSTSDNFVTTPSIGNNMSDLVNASGTEKDEKGKNQEQNAVIEAASTVPEVIRKAAAEKTVLDLVVDDIVNILQPRASQREYRASVSGFVRKQTKFALTASNTFDIGLYTLSCQLPDDPQTMSIIVSKGHVPGWHKNVLNRLHVAMDKHNYQHHYDDNAADEGGHDSHHRHVISNIHYSDSSAQQAGGGGHKQVPTTTNDLSHKVHCVVDALEVEVVPNARTDLCLLAFIEEVAQLVGQDDLFKRSVLLIRAWWVYETGNYVGSAIKHYLSDNAILLMIAALFNQYHVELTSPILALQMFLKIYSKYDGFSEVITLQGIVPYSQSKQQSVNSASGQANQITLISPDPDKHLIPAALLDKYYRLVNAVNGVDTSLPRGVSAGSSAVLSSMVVDSGTSTTSGASVASIEHQSTGDNAVNPVTPPVIIKPPLVIVPATKSITITVERSGYNVLSPFTHANLVAEKMTTRRVVLMHKAFQIGTSNLLVILNAANVAMEGTEGSNGGDVSLLKGAADIRSFFPACMARFKDHWRPDSANNCIDINDKSFSAITDEEREATSTAVVESLWEEVKYCNFVMESVVTESVIVQLTEECLASRGALPVGEIGKMLTDMSSIAHLSRILKELYGGLKKLLEKYSAVFLVANNHQFNPWVVLRKTLSKEQEGLIMSGVFPPEIFKVKAPELTLPQGNNNMYGGTSPSIPIVAPGHSIRSASPLSMQQQHGGVLTPNYLNYNVNTSLDRRMRQSMTNPAAGATVTALGGPSSQLQQNGPPVPRGLGMMSMSNKQYHPQGQQQQQQQQQMHQSMMMNNAYQQQQQQPPPHLQGMPYNRSKQQMLQQQQQQHQMQLKSQQQLGRHPQTMQMMHQQQQQQAGSELDWSDYDASPFQQQQQNAPGGLTLQQMQRRQQQQQQSQQHMQQHHRSLSANNMIGAGNQQQPSLFASQSGSSLLTAASANQASSSVLSNPAFLLSTNSRGSSHNSNNSNFFLGDEEEDLYGLQQQQHNMTTASFKQQSSQQPQYFETFDEYGGMSNQLDGYHQQQQHQQQHDDDIDYLSPAVLGSSNNTGAADSMNSGLWGESSMLFTPSPPSTSSWLK